MQRVLLLTPWLSPHKIIDWKTAVTMKWEDTADVLHEYEYDICSPSLTWKLPSVMRLHNLPKIPKRQIKLSRHAIYARDKYFCMYCGSDKFPVKELTLDHVIPRSKGGKSVWTNLCCCCRACNSRKGNKSCEEANMFPLIKPIKPASPPYYKPMFETVYVPPEWEPFI